MYKADVPALKEWLLDRSIYTYWGKTAKHPELLFKKEGKPTKHFHLEIEKKNAAKVVGDLWV